ncbi:unnamed protein product [Rotaria sp. Silwood2]|nr:unnamed protein product [Rotaria sp. Silwood2]CAF2948412.1 unnamed protein product [Rotaria sp. Silwood2]CAF3227845.1 unnamed protein product [Rotaria sp. Silwood2]CAF3328746.1 unnamed protein product [Rotaria sp. Silwood2]CAF4159649.1 unnamed protein product [Rotaria sp. Silwood2]
MLSLLLIIIPLLSQYQVFSSPVLLWSNSDLPRSTVPLSTYASLDVISNYICKINSKKIQINLLFVEQLTNEDIQRGLQSKHPILLDAKNEKSQFRYFPNVAKDIYETLSLIPRSNNMHCSHIHFQITSSKIYEKLHDALNAMQASVDSGKNSNQVVVTALIGDSVDQSLSRRRRDVGVNDDNLIISENRTCMFYADKLFWEQANEQDSSAGNFTLDLDRSSCTPYEVESSNGNITSVTLDLYWNNGINDTVSMTLIANVTDRYWYLDKAILNDSEYRYFAYGMHSEMETPLTYSYVCKTAVFVKYNSAIKYGLYDFKNKFFITNIQFQPFNANGAYFGLPNYCTSFFTSGIWMGLTSSLLCLGILLFGIHRMMSIKSNDRFDDPKGKPLIIKAQE